MRVDDMLQEIYMTEHNVLLESFWDGGWRAKIGDALNGFKVETDWGSLEKVVTMIYEWTMEWKAKQEQL